MSSTSRYRYASSGPRHILLLTQLPPPYGGLTVHSQRLRATLERHGLHIDVVSPPARSPDSSWLGALRGRVAYLSFLGRLLLRRGDLIHDHISTYPVGELGLRSVALHLALLVALRFGRSPWIVSCGNGLLPGRFAGVPSWLRGIYRFLYGGCVAAIAKNEPIRNSLQALGVGGTVEVVGTFLEPLHPTASTSPTPQFERFCSLHPIRIVSAGFRFEPLYHLDAVVRAVAFLQKSGAFSGAEGRVGLILLGSHSEDPAGFAALKQALEETGLEESVLILRDIDHALDVVARASAFVRATDYDGDANTIKEAMLMEVPILATDLPGRPPGLELIARTSLADLGPRLLEVLLARDEEQIRANRAFVTDDIVRNEEAILRIYARAGGR